MKKIKRIRIYKGSLWVTKNRTDIYIALESFITREPSTSFIKIRSVRSSNNDPFDCCVEDLLRVCRKIV